MRLGTASGASPESIIIQRGYLLALSRRAQELVPQLEQVLASALQRVGAEAIGEGWTVRYEKIAQGAIDARLAARCDCEAIMCLKARVPSHGFHPAHIVRRSSSSCPCLEAHGITLRQA